MNKVSLQEDDFSVLVNKTLRGDNEALYKLIYLLSEYDGADCNLKRRVTSLCEWLTTLLESMPNNHIAQTLLGVLYSGEIRTLEDTNKANEFFDSAIKLGNINAVAFKAFMLEEGRGIAVDLPAARALYEIASEYNNVLAMVKLANIYRHEKSYNQAAILYDSAIELYRSGTYFPNIGEVLNSRAYMHQMGHGGPKNYPVAIRLYEEAIDRRNINAMYNRAMMYYKGHGEPNNYPNPACAVRLFARSFSFASGSFRFHEKSASNSFSFLEKIKQRLEQLVKENPSNLLCLYYYSVSVSRNNLSEFTRANPTEFILFLSEDDSISDKASFFDSFWYYRDALPKRLQNPKALANFIEFQTQIAEGEILKIQGFTSIPNEFYSQFYSNRIKRAFQLAESAFSRLQKIIVDNEVHDIEMMRLFDGIHERLLLAICEMTLQDAHENTENFVECVSYLLQLPSSPNAIYKLSELLFRSKMEPYFSWQEKYQLILSFVNRIDKKNKSSDLCVLTQNISHSLLANKPSLRIYDVQHVTQELNIPEATQIDLLSRFDCYVEYLRLYPSCQDIIAHPGNYPGFFQHKNAAKCSNIADDVIKVKIFDRFMEKYHILMVIKTTLELHSPQVGVWSVFCSILSVVSQYCKAKLC